MLLAEGYATDVVKAMLQGQEDAVGTTVSSNLEHEERLVLL